MDQEPERGNFSLEPADQAVGSPGDAVALRSHLRDVVALLALPAVWSGWDAAHIVGALVDVLSSMLRLDLAYIRATDPASDSPLETARVERRPDLGTWSPQIAGLSTQWLTEGESSQGFTLPHPGTGELLHATRIALSREGRRGVVLAASRRLGFPTSTERFLLQSAVTQAETALHNAALVTALRESNRLKDHALLREQTARADAEAANRAKDELNEELERRVVERTRELAAVNEELRKDVIERTRAQEALRASEERWRKLFENSSVGIVVAGRDRRFLAANSAYQKMIGYTEEELRTLTPMDITHEDDRAATGVLLAELEEGRRQAYEIEKRHRRKDGTVMWVNVSAFFIPASASTLALFPAIVVDITERKLAEESLRTAQAELAHVARVATVGELAASLAHELNQPLAAVVTNGSACLRWLGRDQPNLDEATEAVRRIIRDATRASDVIAHTRAVLKKSDGERTPLNMTEVIREVLVLAGPEVRRHRILVQQLLGEDLPPVLGVRVQLQQVALNLIMNAIEAMADVSDRRRELGIRSQGQEVDDGPGVLVAVEDAGIGFAQENLDRLFEAFYTTKSHGLGMGLSISRSIIQAHGGRLWATPNAGHGATFQFVLPARKEPVS